MKKVLLSFLFALLLCIGAMAADVVYLDGTGETEGAFVTLSDAVSALPNGGTVVLSGDTVIATATKLPATGAITLTSKYDGKDYTETAALKFEANLTLDADTTFTDIVLERTKAADGFLFIIAEGHHLTMDTGVICLNYTGRQWLTLVGGLYSGTFTGDTHITVKSGRFFSVYGGSRVGTFTGNTYVDITGGIFDHMVVGACYNADMTGDAHLTFGGEATFIDGQNSGYAVMGGMFGTNGDTAKTHVGDVYLTLSGNSAINGTVYGAARGDNVTQKGNVYVTVKDNALAYTMYAGGRASTVDGNITLTVEGGELKANVYGGSYLGTVTGNTTVNIQGGKLCYYNVHLPSSRSSPVGTRNVYGGCASDGTLGGTSTVLMTGGSVYGNINSQVITMENGTVFGKLLGDTATVDLSEGGTVSIGKDTTVTSLVGGGKLILAAGASLTTDTVSGIVDLSINGLPLPKAYLTASTVSDGAAVNYIAQEEETLLAENGIYSIDFTDAASAVKVTIEHMEGCTVEVRTAAIKSGDAIAQDSSTTTSATYTLAPGLYNAKVAYTSSNYRRQSFYVDGRGDTQTVEVKYEPRTDEGFQAKSTSRPTTNVTQAHFSTEGMAVDSPYFNTRPGSVKFTTNDEANDFIRAKAENCDYMHVFFPVKTKSGYDFPIVVFTKDEVPEGATIEEIAGIVREKEGREIFFITAQVHGNEPAAGEGALAFLSEMCGDYGKELLANELVGAVVMVPRMSPEGSYVFTRPSPVDVLNTNLNRDNLLLEDIGIAAMAYAAQLFMPTVSLDCHEDHIEPTFTESDWELQTDIYDYGVCHSGSANVLQADTKGVLYGDLSAGRDLIYANLSLRLQDAMAAKGFRTYYYGTAGVGRTVPSIIVCKDYFSALGTCAYTVETPGIGGGNEHFLRRVYTQVTGIKTMFGLVLEEEGAVAAAVAAAREKAALFAQQYDPRSAIILSHAQSRIHTYNYTWNCPIVAADGTVRLAENEVAHGAINVADRYRTRPTAYVFPADAENVSKVLTTLTKQNIAFYKLDSGTTLSLQKYSGSVTKAYVGAAADVTFANGAYIIPVDGVRSVITMSLFEPDNYDTDEGYCSFVQAGYLTLADVYRSTESFIAAKMGYDGTYKALEIPAGKTVLSAVVDGVPYDTVSADAENAYIIASDSEYYKAILTFADGTEETHYIGTRAGDMNGDFEIELVDALLLLHSILNKSPAANGDMNLDGRINLLDTLHLLKGIAK